MEKKKVLLGLIVLAICILAGLCYLSWFSMQEGQSTLHAYPITINPDGSGTSSIMEHVDKSLIANATHLSDKDFSQYPAIAEAITGKRNAGRGFSKIGGVDPGDESVFTRKYFISEYEGNYYLLLVTLH